MNNFNIFKTFLLTTIKKFKLKTITSNTHTQINQKFIYESLVRQNK